MPFIGNEKPFDLLEFQQPPLISGIGIPFIKVPQHVDGMKIIKREKKKTCIRSMLKIIFTTVSLDLEEILIRNRIRWQELLYILSTIDYQMTVLLSYPGKKIMNYLKSLNIGLNISMEKSKVMLDDKLVLQWILIWTWVWEKVR